jgi:hypothetical protein
MICQGLKALGRNCSKESIEQIYMDVLATKIGGQRELLKKSDLIRTVIKEAYGDFSE